MKESYRTVAREAEIELTINRSRFIGYCAPVADEAEALALLSARRKAHTMATHNVYAYAIDPDRMAARYSDDGEPDGTAGMPTLEIIAQKDVTALIVVTTRYFGGVLLGAGGLVRAYASAASKAIDAATPLLMRLSAHYAITVDYPLWGKVEQFLRSGDCRLESAEFGEKVSAVAQVPRSGAASFEKALVELSGGKLRPVKQAEGYLPWNIDLN